MTIETLLNISRKLHAPSKSIGLYAELRVKRIDEYSVMVYLESYIGHIMPGILFRFDSNGNQTDKKIKIPKFTIFLIAVAWIWTIFLMFSNQNSLSSWPILFFPTILTIIIIGVGYYVTERKLNTMKNQLESKK